MTELNILEMFKFAFSAIITSKAIVLLAFELIVFVVYLIVKNFLCNKFIKTVFFGTELVIMTCYIGMSFNTFTIFFNNVITGIMDIIYFPSPLILTSIIGIMIFLTVKSLKGDNKIIKTVNLVLTTLFISMIAISVKYISIRKIDFNEFSIFSNKELMSLNQLVTILFLVWISILLIRKLDKYAISSLVKDANNNYIDTNDIVSIDVDDSIEEKSNIIIDEDGEEIEMPRLKSAI